MTDRRRWGRAGQPLTPQDADVIARRRAARTLAVQRAHRAWAAGEVVPHRITAALNLRGLYGPEVDEACGVVEPAVDEWEAGVRYPTWEQLVALAELTTFPVVFFVMPLPDDVLGVEQTSLRFHRVAGRMADWRDPPPVRVFTRRALDAARQGGLW